MTGGGFARVPIGSLPALVGSGVLSVQGAVYLCLLRWAKPDGTAFCPRRSVAGTLGITEQAVSNAVKSLIRKGAVEVVSRGHNGRATVYRVARKGGLPGTRR